MIMFGNVTRLRYFKTVVECGTITKAAEVLNISQPSLTAAIKELEKELNIVLFNRSKNSITLSQQGQFVYEKTINMLQTFDAYYKSIVDYGDKAGKIVNIGVPPVIGTMIIPRLIENAKSIYEDSIEIHIIECNTSEACDKLDDNTLDFALFLHNSIPDRYSHKLIDTSEMCYTVSNSHPLAGCDTVSVKDVVKYPLISLPRNSFHNEMMQQRFDEAGIKPSIKLYTSQLYTILRVLDKNAENEGAFLFRDVIDLNYNIKKIPFKDPILCSFNIAWKNTNTLNSAQKKVCKIVTKCIAEMKANSY